MSHDDLIDYFVKFGQLADLKVFLTSILVKYDEKIDESILLADLRESSLIATFINDDEYKAKLEECTTDIDKRLHDYYKFKLESERPVDCEILIADKGLQ